MGEDVTKREAIGWTMIIIIVLCLLLVMIAIGFPIWGLISQRAKVNATESLVNSVATAITTYQTKTWAWKEGTSSESRTRTYHLFDLNRDNQIDGYVAVTASPTQDGGFPQEVIDSGYTGFVDMAKPAIKPSFVSRQGIPVDAWKRPLRIAFASMVYGTQAFGVWSAGLDGIDGTADDLRSWTPKP
jgi:type II secretory pathway pseudopilin PulG